MALQRIGARGTISSLTEDSPNAIKVNNVWDMVFAEVLSERDWKFAKTRAQLQQNTSKPIGSYRYAYTLPSDFLRLCKPREIPEERKIANFAWIGNYNGYGYDNDYWHPDDHPIIPREVDPYITEAVLVFGSNPPSYTNNLLTNYPYGCDYSCSCPIVINYIRLITDLSQLLPGFVNALAYRLAGELAVPVTEDLKKSEGGMQMYAQTLNSAQAQQECDDYLKDEAGNFNWLNAGRFRGRH